MPIFKYVCKKCENNFEAFVRGSITVKCPSCKSKRLEKQLSVFAMSVKGRQGVSRDEFVSPCGSCGDARGPGACSVS